MIPNELKMTFSARSFKMYDRLIIEINFHSRIAKVTCVTTDAYGEM